MKLPLTGTVLQLLNYLASYVVIRHKSCILRYNLISAVLIHLLVLYMQIDMSCLVALKLKEIRSLLVFYYRFLNHSLLSFVVFINN